MSLQSDYADEHAANAGTLELLEAETNERMRLERQLAETSAAHDLTTKRLEQCEADLIEARLLATTKSIESELSSSSSSSNAEQQQSSNKQQQQHVDVQRLQKDADMLKKQLREERAHANELSRSERAFFEHKLAERDAELLELERQCAAHKRLWQKASNELQDVERAHEESRTRTRDLERIQQRHDAELAAWRARCEAEREARDKCERERDSAKYELATTLTQLEQSRDELSACVAKCERLERDLKEYEANNGSGGGGGCAAATSGGQFDQFVKLKAQIREMEAKVRKPTFFR